MKKILTIFLSVSLVIMAIMATGPVFNVHKSDGKISNFMLSNIDSLKIINNNSDLTVFKKDGTQSTVSINLIDSTAFDTASYTIPSVELVSATFNYTTGNSATCVARVISNGGCPLVERGICWSNITSLPTIRHSKYASGTTVGQFYAMMSGLELNKTYYVRTYATNCAGTAYGNTIKVQPLSGNVTYSFDQSVIDAGATVQNLLKIALDSACYYYNRYTTFKANIWIYYNAGIPTAQANYHGSIGFGPSQSYMWVGTTMHEMAHYFGSGTSTAWKNLMVGGVWQGAAGTALCQQLTGQTLKGDNNSNPIHYWPTGINYRSEVGSQTDLINHAKIIKAMLIDDCKLPASW